MRVNELAGERAGESEPTIMTTYYVYTVRGYSKTEANGICGDTVFRAASLDETRINLTN